jgi:outer membrane receptor protein involved in Fe transport
MLRRYPVALAIALACLGAPALGDDLADEAQLHFELGATAYQRSDFERALEHFLISNRLVANKNVLFNIARCFEQLGRFPEAFRYYDLARAVEADSTALTTIDDALSRMANKVAMVTVTSEPKGATIYFDRKDLGPRGTAPRRLGLPAGEYVLIVELPGYHDGRMSTGRIEVGESRTIRIELQPILGEIRIGGELGTRVSVDRGSEGTTCVTPCTLVVPEGRRSLRFTREGREAQETSVEVRRDTPVVLSPRLPPRTGSILVDTDEPNALVEIDGQPRGFTPTVVTIPVGVHPLRVTKPGYKPIVREVSVEAERQTRMELELIADEQVQGVARRVEAVEDTATSVSIVSQRELRALAYPTVAEALRGLPGVYFWDDRGYVGIGMRGIGRLGSYGNRVLVLLDGVPMNDNWLGSAYVGHDLMTDLGDIERVELIRGPGSAVYGTSAFSGVVNLVTRRATQSGVEAGASTSLDGVARGRARASWSFGRAGGVWASLSLGRSEGRSFYFPEYRDVASTPNAEPGWSRGHDGMRSVSTQGQASHGAWSARWFYHRYEKQLPGAPYDTTFGDPRTRQTDERGFLELRVDPRLTSRTTTSTRLVLNRYGFRGAYARALIRDDQGRYADGLEVDQFRGHWATAEQRLVFSFSSRVSLTLGGEGVYHFDVRQTARDAGGDLLRQVGDGQKRYGVLAAYGILDAAIGKRAKVSLGGRVDHYTTFGTSLSPRVGVVVTPYERGNTKLTAGRAFRAPSIYELYYNDNRRTQIASPNLLPETILSAEVEHTHRITSTIALSGAAYVNYVRGLIDTTGAGTSFDPLQFVSTRNPLTTMGAELGIRRDFRGGWMLSAYYGYSRAEVLADGRLSTFLRLDKEPGIRNVANTPTHAATFKGIAPFLVRGLSLSTRMTFEDRRWDRYEHDGEPRQLRTRAAALWDLVMLAEDEKRNLSAAFGVYNVFEYRYRFPVGSEYSPLRTMPAAGRSLLLSVEIRR